VNVCPPIVSVPVRAPTVVFAAAVNVTIPAPLPLAGETVTQLAPLVAVHAHPARLVRLTVPLPPDAATVCAFDPRLYTHAAVSWVTVTV
jgi:hypothetical protein